MGKALASAVGSKACLAIVVALTFALSGSAFAAAPADPMFEAGDFTTMFSAAKPFLIAIMGTLLTVSLGFAAYKAISSKGARGIKGG
jgi:hypothetical protein